MTHQDSLLSAALIGSSTAPLPASDHPADEVVAVIDRSPEEIVLLRAGARRLYERAGHEGAATGEPIPPCDPESRVIGTTQLTPLLRDEVLTGQRELAVPTFARMHELRVVLPPEVLPTVLSLSRKREREAALPILGTRGRWLAHLNADWEWGLAAGTVFDAADATSDLQAMEAEFTQGVAATRLAVLKRVRRAEPATAREWLNEVFKSESAKDRDAFVKCLGVGLSMDDEPFLEVCLKDRAGAVRVSAGGLLSRLPDSAYSVRMRERAEAMLTLESKGLIKKKPVLRCDPPESLDKDWKYDGVPEKATAGRGKRATWAHAVLRAVPPHHWSAKFERAPAELIEAVRDDNFADAILDAWTDAITFATDNVEWVVALASIWMEFAEKKRGEAAQKALAKASALVPLLPAEDIETTLREKLIGSRAAQVQGFQILNDAKCAWSDKFLSWFVSQARSVLGRKCDEMSVSWAEALVRMAPHLSPAGLATASEPWTVGEPDKQAWHHNTVSRHVQAFQHTMSVRVAIEEELQKSIRGVGGAS